MPNPKRRHSNTRTRKRRTHDKMKAMGTSGCANCGNPIPPHRVCPKCGYYKGKQVINIKAKAKKTK
jgi:large subunit ribosomal protein L32